MNADELKEKIAMAKKAVEGEKDPIIKADAFKIILSKLLDSDVYIPNQKNSNLKSVVKENKNENNNFEEKKAELAKKCNITVNDLNNVISLKNNIVEVVSPLRGTDAQKHVVVAKCVLAAYEVIFGQEWVNSTILAECIRSVGVKDLKNISQSLKKVGELIIGRGVGRYREYRLTSSNGRSSAFQTIANLSKGESVE